MADPSFNFNPSSAFNFEPPQSFGSPDPGASLFGGIGSTGLDSFSKASEEYYPLLNQEVFNPSQPDLNFDPFSSFNVEPSPAFNFNPSRPDLNFDPSSLFNVEPSPSFNFNLPPSFNVPQPEPQIVDTINQPGYLERLREFVEPVFNRDQGLFDVDRLGTAANDLLGSAMRNLTPKDELGYTPEPFGKTFTDTFAITRPDGTKFYPDEVEQPSSLSMVSDVEEDIKNSELNEQAAQELSRLMEGVSANSPQANFLAEKAKGDLTSKQIADANAFAKSIGTTFDSELGYDRTSFLESKSGQPQVTQEQLQQLASPGPIAPMGRDATKALIAKRLGLNAPATLNQATTNNPNAVMATDAQGRMRSFASPQARQQNLANAQAAFNQESLNRQIRDGGTGSYAGDSAARMARVNAGDKRPGETQADRDTRMADSRTEGSDRGGEMSFSEARKFVPKGEKESTKAYNERIKAFQAQQNSTINKLKEEYEQFRVNGQELNNEKTNALIANYQQTEPEKYRETYKVAQEMLNDGILKDETQMAMYVIDEMGGKSSDIFDTTRMFMGGDDGAFNPSQLSPQDREAYNFAINNPGDERSQKILDKLGAN